MARLLVTGGGIVTCIAFSAHKHALLWWGAGQYNNCLTMAERSFSIVTTSIL